MDGIHDLGGMHGFGRVSVEPDEAPFHARWEARVLGMAFQVVGGGWTNVDAFRHAIERIDPVAYLTVGYYGRWLRAIEKTLIEADVLAPGEVDARVSSSREARDPAPAAPTPRHGGFGGVIRPVERPPRFSAGDAVVARNLHPSGHTRLPRYVRGKRGLVRHVHPACIFPDSHAHGLGENPQYLYSVRFTGSELWGTDAEPGSAVHLDLFEDYLAPAGDQR